MRSFLDELKHGTKKYKTIASLSGQIAEAYRGRCVLELLQNAHDALADSPDRDPRLITFLLETEPAPVLLIANSGLSFEQENFKGLCQLGQSPKDPNKSVGNKGLGFRSVLEVASAPEIWSTATTEGEPAFVFRFDPGVRERVAAALADLNANGLGARSPFDPSERLVDWTEDQLRKYRDRLAEEDVDGPGEARAFLSPYDIPLPIEGRRDVVDDLLRDGHVTVVCLPLDGGRTGDAEDAVASVQAQLKGLLDVSTTLFLPRLRTLVVDIDGEMTVVKRTVDAVHAFGEGGQCQRVGISRSYLTGEEDATGRFRVWTRALGGKEDPQWAARIRDAVQHLPNKWPEVDSVQVGVAVREGEENTDGRFVIFLPTEMATGTGAHINAPFFATLDRRRIMFDDEYNRLLLDCVVDLSFDAIDELATGEPEDARGRAIVDILSSDDEVGETGESMLALLRKRAAGEGIPLDEWQLILCDDGWSAPVDARAMPQVADSLAIGAEDWRRAAAFAVVSSALDGRESEVKVLLRDLGGSATPTDVEWRRTVEQAALQVQSGQIDATWDGFLTSVLKVLPWELVREPLPGTEDALASAKFLPDQDGRLISTDDPARVFFQPVVGIDDAAELVGTVPDSLKERIAFIHGDVRTHEEGAQRRRTEVHKFLDDRFARGFGREEIVREVVLAALPPMPVPFESVDAELCAELLGWTLGLLGEDPSEALLALLKGLPMACHGGWRPAREANFGPGWPGSARGDLRDLSEELRGDAAVRLRETALLDPEDLRWGVDVDGRGDLFARIGVAEGLRLRPVDDMQFGMQHRDYELPQTAPAGVESAAWEEWRTAVRLEAEPRYLGWFEYSLEGLFHLPELYGCRDLSQRGRRAFSRLVVHSMRGWPDGWEKATLRKVRGAPSTWRITSPLKHWLSSMAWLSDGGMAERPLPDRWFVPTSLLRDQGERFRHLRPLSLDLSRRLDEDLELVEGLKGLGLNVYPTDGEKIGPELLDALAEAWRGQRVPLGRFDIFLGQLRHAWQHLDESNGLPGVFLVRTARRGFKVLDGDSLGDVYLPNDDEKGRSLREEKQHVLEMELREANRLAEVLVETTAVRLASELVERELIDGAEWTGDSDAVRSLEETRYRWLPAVLLAIQAHGGPNPTGHTTAGWADALTRLRGAGVVECKSIAIELVAGGETIAKSEPVARWLKGDVLAVISKTGAAYEALAPAAQAMLDRQDLLKDLRLVLGALDEFEAPSLEQVESALDRAEIDRQAFADIRSRWAGNTGLVASRIRAVAALLGVAGEEFEAAALSTDALTDWLADNVPQWEALELLSAARRSRDDHAMGLAAWRALGDVAQLPEWNAVLNRLGDEYETVRNKLAHEQTVAHLEAMQAFLPALAREIAVDCDEPQLFRKIEDATRAFVEPDEWSQRWWEVPFVAVVDALFKKYRGIVDAGHHEALRGVTSASQLRVALEERGVEIDPDPYETARVNSSRFNNVLLNVHDLYRTWLEIHAPESEVPDRPTAPELGGDAYLRRWSNGELWHRALAVLDDRKFAAACGELSDLQTVSERLGIHKEAIDAKRRERAEQEREAARKPKTVEIAGESFEMETIDYAELLRQHTATLAHPRGPRAGEGEFTPLGPFARHGGSGGGGEKEGKSAHRCLSPEEAEVIGIVGEMHAYRYLRKEFGGRAVRSAAWVSESRLKVLPPVEGETVEVSDGHGFDFRFNYDGIRWHVEVKATKGEETSFNLGISEIEAATRIARRRRKTWRWGILRVRNTLSTDPGIDWLPNPFEEGFQKHYRLNGGGMVVSYARCRT